MKAKYLILTLIASLAALVGCQKETSTYLEELQVSSSYIAFPADGGTVTMTLTAQGSWTINDLPEWVTANPASGSAGTNTVTFTAPAAESTREAIVTITCGTGTQRINITQVTEAVEPETLTVAEAIALGYAIADGTASEQTIRVRGIVCKIDEISTSYGNATYYLSDDGTYSGSHSSRDANWFEVYRGYWINSAKFSTGDEFAIGDELVVQGVIISYNGIPETNSGTAEVISIKKSLIGIESVELLGVKEGTGITEFPKDGGSIKITVMTKGDGFHVVIPDEAKNWLHIEDFGSNYVTLSADANTAGDRFVSVTFTTEADGTTYTCEQSFSQEGSIVDATAAEIIAGPDGTQYRMTGCITSIANAKYGNFYLTDFSGTVYIYGTVDTDGNYLNLTENGFNVGDIVTVVGAKTTFGSTVELVNVVVENHVSVKEVSIEEFLSMPDDKNVFYMVTGTIKEIDTPATYGNLYMTDGTNDIYVYGCYPGYGATGDDRKNFLETAGIKVGDELTMIGYKDTYNGKIELCGGTYFSHKSAE